MVAILRPWLMHQIDDVTTSWSFVTVCLCVVVCEVIASTTFTALVSQYTIKSYSSKLPWAMFIAWVANMTLDGLNSFLRIRQGQQLAAWLVSEYWPVLAITCLTILVSPPKLFKFEIAKIALLMLVCDAATAQLQYENVPVPGWKDMFSTCQLVGKLMSLPIVYFAMSFTDKRSVTTKNTCDFKSKVFVVAAQLGRTFSYATFICLARAITQEPESWWGPVILPLNISIPLVGIHIAAPVWLMLLGPDSLTIELLTRTISKTTAFGLCLLLIGFFVPFAQGYLMAIAVTCLVSTDILFDQLMPLLGLNAGQVALQKTTDSLLLPSMTLMMSLNSQIGKDSDGNIQYADKALRSFHLILLVTTTISVVALQLLSKTKKD